LIRKEIFPPWLWVFDGQGYFFDKTTDKYAEREHGLYLVGSGEILAPNLTRVGGANMYDFSNDYVYVLPVFPTSTKMFNVSGELDNIASGAMSAVNFGIRYYVTPNFSIQLAARDLWSVRPSERIVRLGYFGSF